MEFLKDKYHKKKEEEEDHLCKDTRHIELTIIHCKIMIEVTNTMKNEGNLLMKKRSIFLKNLKYNRNN